jgi:hypothetical protein
VIQPKKPTDLTPLASYLQSLATGDTAAIEARDGSKKHEKTDQFNLRWLTLVDTRSWCDAAPLSAREYNENNRSENSDHQQS